MNARKDTAVTILVGPILDEDGVAKTNEVVASIKASKNGTVGALNGSATLTHSAGGVYKLALTTSDTDTLGVLEITLDSGTNSMAVVHLNVMTATAWDALYAASGGYVPSAPVDDSIKAATFDESTAFPLKSADTGATAVARTGADSDTLETLSDQLDAVPAGVVDEWETQSQADPTGFQVNVKEVNGTAAEPETSPVDANVTQIIGTALTETSAGYLAAAFKKFFDVAVPVFTTASVNQTGDSYPYLHQDWNDDGELLANDITAFATNIKRAADAYTRLGAPAGASVSADIAAVKTDTGNLITRIPAALFTGITSLAQWLGLIAGKQTGNSTARTEIRATGAGSGTFLETADSLEALRDRGDAAWATATGFSTLDAAGVRTAVGLESANLDTQLAALPTATENADALLGRNVSNVEATAGEHTLCTIVLASLESSVSGTTWTIKRTDGSTTHATKTVTSSASANPITGVS